MGIEGGDTVHLILKFSGEGARGGGGGGGRFKLSMGRVHRPASENILSYNKLY